MYRAVPALLLLAVVNSASAQPPERNLVVFMREDPTAGKQIWRMEADATGARPLTEDPAWHLYPAISADGHEVAYVVGPDDKNQALVVQRLDVGLLEQWTEASGRRLQADFSGDGHLLAFVGPLGPGGADRIGLLPLPRARAETTPVAVGEGHNRRQVYAWKPRVVESPFPAYFPALSSDGSFLVYHRTRSKEDKQVVEVDLASGVEKALTPDEGKCMAPALSFDDRTVVCTCLRDGNWDVYTVDRATGRERRVTTDPSEDFAPTFTPRGEILFASKRRGHFELYLAPVSAGGGAEKLVAEANGGDLYAPSVSGDLRLVQGKLPEIPSPARSSFGVVEHRGSVYVAGGHTGPEHTYPAESFVHRFDRYDVAARRWEPLTPRQVASQGFDLVAEGDYLYAFGGFAHSAEHVPGWRSLDVIERYSVREDRWEVIGRLPRPRSSYVAARVGNLVYLIGGWDATPRSPGDEGGHFHPEIDVFDLATGKASESPYRLPAPLRRAFTGLVRGGKVLLFGGLGPGSAHSDLLGNVTEFDPANGTWTELPALPFPTFAPAAAEFDGRLYVMGGLLKTGPGPKDSVYLNHIYAFDPQEGGWVHTGRYLAETKGFARVVTLAPGVLGVLGGHSRAGGVDGPVPTFESLSRR